MGILVISIVTLISLILGVISVIMVFMLAQRNDKPFLNNFLIFLILAVISGFCDWIIINWTLVLVKGIPMDTADLIYHIFWDLVGFPAYLFAFFFLVKTLNNLAGLSMSKPYQRFFTAALLAVILVNYIGFYFRIKDDPFLLSKVIWMIYTIIWPLAYLAYLAYAYFRPVRKEGKRPTGYFRFVLLFFAGFLVWTLLSLLPLKPVEGRHLIIVSYFLTLFLPALYLFIRPEEFFDSKGIKTNRALEQSLAERGFSTREIELALLLMAGKSNQEISDELFVSVQTVKNYLSKMYRKAGVSSRTQFIGIFAKYPDPE